MDRGQESEVLTREARGAFIKSRVRLLQTSPRLLPKVQNCNRKLFK